MKYTGWYQNEFNVQGYVEPPVPDLVREGVHVEA
jgi:hypothetical protein